MKQSFTIRVFTIHFLVLALPLIITSFVFFNQFYANKLSVVREQLIESAHYAAFSVNSLEPVPVQALDDILFFLPKDPHQAAKAIKELNTQADQTLFTLLSAQQNGVDDYLEIGDSSDPVKVFRSGGGIESIIKHGKGAFIRYLSTPQFPSPHLVYFVGRTSPSDHGTGVLLLAQSNIEQKIGEILKTAQGSNLSMALLNQNGVVLSASGHALEGYTFAPLSDTESWLLQNSGALGRLTLVLDPVKPLPAVEQSSSDFFFQSNEYLAYRVQLPDTDYSIMTFVSKKTVFLSAMQQFAWIYSMYAIVLIIGVLLAFFLSHWVSKPLRQLSFVMNKANAGNLDARFRDSPFGFEVNQLGHRFNQTLQALIQNIQQEEDERVKKETYLKEIDIGREVQKSLLTLQIPFNDQVEIGAVYLQAENVGGDFYCAEETSDNSYLLAVGDAAGKGIGSCLYALVVRSLIRSYSHLYSQVGEVLSATNNAFLQQTADTGMFVTVLMGKYDPFKRMLSYFSCGHPPGIIRRKEGAIEMLAHSGMALGLLESNPFQEESAFLDPGDMVLFFTKGLIEGVNQKNQFFSERRVHELLQQRKWSTAKEVVDGLTKEYRDFIGSTVQDEEVVILALNIRPADSKG